MSTRSSTKDCLCGQALGYRNTSGFCKWCYRRWKYLQSTTKGRARGVRKLKTIIKGLP